MVSLSSLARTGVCISLGGSLLLSCQAPSGPRAFSPAPANLPAAGVRGLQAESQLRLQDNTVLYDQPVPVDIRGDVLVFENLSRPIQPGQVLMGRALSGEDFLRRAVSVRSEGSQTRVQTTAATLFDAFRSLEAHGIRGPRNGPQRISLRSQRFNIGGVLDLVVDLGVRPDFSDAHIELKNKRLKVDLAPRFNLDAQVRTELNFLRPVSELTRVGAVQFSVARFPVWVGPVPVVFKIKPGAALSWSHQASGVLAQGLKLEGYLKPSVSLEAALKQKPRATGGLQQRIQASAEAPALRMRGQAQARIYVPQLQFSSELAGLVGPFISAGTYVDGRFTGQQSGGQSQGYLRADLGVAVEAGITPTRLFGQALSREIRVKVVEKTLKTLYEKRLSNS